MLIYTVLAHDDDKTVKSGFFQYQLARVPCGNNEKYF